MNKKVLIISSSPRKDGNSETLAAAFANGARESGNQVESPQFPFWSHRCSLQLSDGTERTNPSAPAPSAPPLLQCCGLAEKACLLGSTPVQTAHHHSILQI